MHDLSELAAGGRYPADPDAPVAIAMVHRSFRAAAALRGRPRERLFGAHFPALGLLNLAQSLRADAAAGLVREPVMRYFDEESYEDEAQLAAAVQEWLSAQEGRLILAASAYTATIDRLEAFLGRFDPNAQLIVVGGAHATLAPAIENTHIVVRGEGAGAMRHILTDLFSSEFGRGHDAVGISYRVGGEEVMARRPAFDQSIRTVPTPAFAYDLLPPKDARPIYATNFARMLGRRPQIYVCTQSCRARCSFCSTYLIHGRPVARPASLIREDLHHLVQELEHDSLEFHDDDLLQHPEWDGLLAILADLGVPWFCYGRVDLITPAVASEMAAAGCRRIFIGVESMLQEKLDYFHTGTTIGPMTPKASM